MLFHKAGSVHFGLGMFLLSVVTSQVMGGAPLEVGKKAAEFSAVDTNGKKHSLSQSSGKWVVLEWLNHGCPFVQKHYGSGNMQALQKKYTGKGVVWYSVISSAPGKQGHSDSKKANEEAKLKASAATAILLDPEGKMGTAYGAATTPHMYIIDPKGVLVYQGAMDDKATTEESDIKTAHNYVSAILDPALEGKPFKMASTKAYGCSVKYKNQ